MLCNFEQKLVKINEATNRKPDKKECIKMSFDQIVLMGALLAVAGILGWGVMTMARGGEYNIKNSNRIMRYRIIFQAIALIIILGLMWWRRTGS